MKSKKKNAKRQPVSHTVKPFVGGLDLRCCDCMDLMRECADKAFDLAIVDPQKKN